MRSSKHRQPDVTRQGVRNLDGKQANARRYPSPRECDHEFGYWDAKDGISMIRTCSKCGAVEP